ncbi:YncE family protein [Asticcacaulis solisilvae]|uniref:YncE family protein n=1 Tax=Asticcacaulis solisilvae TaxID=1217274 RepID=UPI003FD82AE8
MKSLIAAASLLALPSAALAGPLHVIDTLKIGGTGGWDYVTFDPAHNRVYVAHGPAISAFDLGTRQAAPAFVATQGAHIALPVDGGKTLLVTNGKSNTVTFNDAMTGAQVASVPTDSKPDAAIVEPVSGQAYVMANGGGTVDVVDVASHTLVAKIPVGGDPEAAAIDGQGLVFTHLEDKNALVVIDGKTHAIKATYAMKDCDEPSGVAFVAKGRLILSACKNGIARITEADTGNEVATLPIGQRPDGALYDAKTGLGYVPSGDGKLTVIGFDGKPHVVDTVTTRAGARTAALDPVTGRVFLPFADYAPPAKAGERPGVVPDTFAILVVGQ